MDRQTLIRDYLSGENVIQTFLLAYLNVTDYYLRRTEDEMGKACPELVEGGFVDLYLEPFWQKYPDVRHGYLIELKYVPRSEWSEARADSRNWRPRRCSSNTIVTILARTTAKA